jgi:hypothetical protein
VNIEQELRDAMATEVADVHAPPSLGTAVRRRHRRHVVRFRAVGAALVTAALAGAVPAYFALNPGAPTGPAGGNDAAASVSTETPVAITVPDVRGQEAAEASEALEAAGLTVELEQQAQSPDAPQASRTALVLGQRPEAGAQVRPGEMITLTLADRADQATDTLPVEVGDLHTGGRRFAGVDWGYLPEGLEWGKWFGRDGFGPGSLTTTWREPGAQEGYYAVQVIVYRGESAAPVIRQMDGYRKQGVDSVKVKGARAYVLPLGEGGERVENGGTPTLVWAQGRDLAVQIMISPDYAEKVDADAELKKIGTRMRPVG